MKLEVGQFVRFKDKRGNTYIRNIKEVCNEQPHKSWGAIIIDKNANNVPYVSLKNIIKASYSIIDILKVGDYVNGYKVTRIGGTFHGKKDKAIYCDYQQNEKTNKWIMIYDDEIKSIVTKEQFESMEYRIGDE